MKVEIIKRYRDAKLKRVVNPEEVYDVTKDRAAKLESLGLVKKIAVKKSPNEEPKGKPNEAKSNQKKSEQSEIDPRGQVSET